MAARRRPPWWGVLWIVVGVAWVVFESLRHKPVGVVVAVAFLAFAVHRSTRVPTPKAAAAEPPAALDLPAGVVLPEIVVHDQINLWRWFGIRAGLPILAVVGTGVVAGFATGNSAESGGALIALGIIAVIIGIEVPLIVGAQRRKRRKMIAESPPGSWFVCPAIQCQTRTVGQSSRPMPGSMRNGRFVLGAAGITFTPPRSTTPASDVRWSTVSRLTVTPVTGILSKVEALVDGQILGWRVAGTKELVAALREHQQ